jgi:hypothetical protein
VFTGQSKALGDEFRKDKRRTSLGQPSVESRAQDQGRAGELLVPNPKLRLREQLREVMRFKHYSVRTEQTYTRTSNVSSRSRKRILRLTRASGGPREVASCGLETTARWTGVWNFSGQFRRGGMGG